MNVSINKLELSKLLSHPLLLVLSLQERVEELKLVVGDTFENVASLQDCHFQQRDSVQTLGKILYCGG